MRTTLTLDADVDALLKQFCKTRETTFKRAVNDALRVGLTQLSSPSETQPFRTEPVDLGNCNFPNLDNIWEVLDEAEQRGSGR